MSAFRFAPALAVLAFAVFASASPAMFMRVDVEKIPVERLAANMEKAIEKDPKSAPP